MMLRNVQRFSLYNLFRNKVNRNEGSRRMNIELRGSNGISVVPLESHLLSELLDIIFLKSSLHKLTICM